MIFLFLFDLTLYCYSPYFAGSMRNPFTSLFVTQIILQQSALILVEENVSQYRVCITKKFMCSASSILTVLALCFWQCYIWYALIFINTTTRAFTVTWAQIRGCWHYLGWRIMLCDEFCVLITFSCSNHHDITNSIIEISKLHYWTLPS